MGLSRKSPHPFVEDKGIPGGAWILKIQWGGESFDGIPVEERKKQRKIQWGGESFDEIPGSTVSENGHPQQGGTDHFWLNLIVTFSC